MTYHTSAIHSIQSRTKVAAIRDIATQPDVQTVWRITVYYVDGRAHNSVATLTQTTGQATLALVTHFVDFCDGRPIARQITQEAYRRLLAVLHGVQFDTMYFPESALLHTPTVWHIERATARFVHQLTLSPHCHDKPYCVVVNAIDSYLPDAIREICQ